MSSKSPCRWLSEIILSGSQGARSLLEVQKQAHASRNSQASYALSKDTGPGLLRWSVKG